MTVNYPNKSSSLISSIFSGRVGNPPATDTIEVTVLGPGYGESIVLHLPGFGWGVIDSCTFENSSLPLHYLKALQVSNLSFVFLSHPHQDHFEGLDEVIDAFQTLEWIGRYNGNSIRELKKYWVRQDMANATKVSDSLSRVFNSMNDATKRGARFLKLSEMVTLARNGQGTSKPYSTKLIVLSPSGMSEESYADALRRHLPRVNKKMKTLRDTDYNLIASAIWIEVNNVRLLLGSDVEKGTFRQTGWKGIVSSPTCPNLEIGAIKVAHHGSSSAHHQEAWTKHKKGNPISMVTPFINGKTVLPGQSDFVRIKAHSRHVGITGEIRFEDPSQHYDKSLVGQTVYDFRSWKILKNQTQAGLLRVRYDLAGNIIEKFSLSPSQWLS